VKIPNTLLVRDSHQLLFTQTADASSKNDEIEDRFIEPELSGTETVSPHKRQLHPSQLFKAIASVSELSVDSTLNDWVEKGEELSMQEIVLVLNSLRRRRMYGRALQVNHSIKLILYLLPI